MYIGCQIYFLLRHLLKEHGPYTFQPIFLCPIIKVQSYQVSPVIFGSVLQFMNVHVSKTICPGLVNQFHVLMTHFFFLFHPLTLLILSTNLSLHSHLHFSALINLFSDQHLPSHLSTNVLSPHSQSLIYHS